MDGSKGMMVCTDAHFLNLLCSPEMPIFSQAAEILQSRKESCLSFWGEKLDEKVEGFVRNYMEDAYRGLSEIVSKMTKRGIQRNASFFLFCLFNVPFP
jgi:endoribonuclease Dicer